MYKKYQYHLSLLLAGFCYSFLEVFSVVLSKMQVPVFNQVFYRCLFGVVTGSIVFKTVFKVDLKVSRKELKYIFINSLILLGGFTTQSLIFFLGTPIAKGVALIYSYPLSLVILSFLILKDMPTRKQLLALFISLISIGILLEIWRIKNLAQISMGEIMAIVNAVFYSLIIIWGKITRTRIPRLHPMKNTAYSLLFLIPLLITVGGILNLFGLPIIKPDITVSFPIKTWATLLGIGFLGTILPMSFLYTGLSMVKPNIAGFFLLTELIWATIWGAILFSQPLSIWGIAGILGIIISVLLV